MAIDYLGMSVEAMPFCDAYFLGKGSRIDRLEVWNPGRLPKGMTVEKLAGEHASLPVNPLLANPVYLAGYIEQVGTGTNDVIDRCVELGLRRPEFRQDEDFMVMRWRKEYLTETSSNQVIGQVAGQVREPVRRLILALAGQTLTRKQMMTLLSLKGRENFRVNYLEPSMAEGLVLKFYPESDNRPDQAFYLSEKGLLLLAELTSK